MNSKISNTVEWKKVRIVRLPFSEEFPWEYFGTEPSGVGDVETRSRTTTLELMFRNYSIDGIAYVIILCKY